MLKTIPIHDFAVDDTTSIPFNIIPLEVKTEYDIAVPHRHNYYEIFIFNEGGGIHEIDFSEIEVKKDSVHFVSPGQVHMLQRAPGSHGYVILFSREFYSMPFHDKDLLFELPFLNNNSKQTYINFSAEFFSEIKDIAFRILEEHKRQSEKTNDIIRSYLHILLLKCKINYKNINNNGTVTGNSLMHRFRILLEKNFRKLHLVKEYASLLALSPENLNEICKKEVGKTASEIITDRIILEAKRLLLYSELNAKEIAYFLNFNDPSYFNKFFKNHSGCSPTQFRNQLNRKYQ